MRRILKRSLHSFYFLLSGRTEYYTASFSRWNKAIKMKMSGYVISQNINKIEYIY